MITVFVCPGCRRSSSWMNGDKVPDVHWGSFWAWVCVCGFHWTPRISHDPVLSYSDPSPLRVMSAYDMDTYVSYTTGSKRGGK